MLKSGQKAWRTNKKGRIYRILKTKAGVCRPDLCVFVFDGPPNQYEISFYASNANMYVTLDLC
jgi:hypothetical protein